MRTSHANETLYFTVSFCLLSSFFSFAYFICCLWSRKELTSAKSYTKMFAGSFQIDFVFVLFLFTVPFYKEPNECNYESKDGRMERPLRTYLRTSKSYYRTLHEALFLTVLPHCHVIGEKRLRNQYNLGDLKIQLITFLYCIMPLKLTKKYVL